MNKKVLIIEDDNFKIRDIKKCLTDWDITAVESVRDGVVSIANEKFDLVILDMSLPTYKKTSRTSSGSSQAQGGLEVLREIKSNADQTKVIIVSQYPDIELDGNLIALEKAPELLKDRYRANMIGAIIYDSESHDWQNKFIEYLATL